MKVTKETIQTDIENTEKELRAYTYLVQGFEILSGLPETEHGRFRLETMKWDRLRDECWDFLQQLKELESEL